MSHPAPNRARIRSEYQVSNKPKFVAKWEQWTNEAPDDVTALIQLTYFQAQQIRAIKLILLWTMIIVPIIVATGLLILSQTVSSPSLSYPF